MSWVCWLLQGQTKSDIRPITSKIGQAKRNSGVRKAVSPWPLVNHTTISLSRYMRDRALTVAMNSDKVRMVGRRPSAE